METNKLNIAEILKEKPKGTKLWTPIFGTVSLFKIYEFHGESIIDINTDGCGIWSFSKEGKFDHRTESQAEMTLFPSKNLLDWSKFAWKKGDVLIGAGRRIIFEKFTEEDYTQFQGLYSLSINDNGDLREFTNNHYTHYFTKIDDDDKIKDYFEVLEKKFKIKLNRKTLEIERTQSESNFFDDLAEACKNCLADLKQEIELQPYDKVLVRDTKRETWSSSFFSYMVKDKETKYPYMTVSGAFAFCIPYNEQTKHLLGTNKTYEED